MNGYLVLETGEIFQGLFAGDKPQVGEVVFNTTHSGYEELATDPSYFSQIVVMTAPMQGNYGESDEDWESKKIWIKGFICLEIQNSHRESSWLTKLNKNAVPVLSGIDTRSLVFRLREGGVVWGCILAAENRQQAKKLAQVELAKTKTEYVQEKTDWTKEVCVEEPFFIEGHKELGPRIAILDFGFKKNILREIQKRSSKVAIFPNYGEKSQIENWKPDGIVLSNGPGDPGLVKEGLENVKSLVGYRPLFGICMGHQMLSLALGGSTFKLKFGHRGGNHPIRDNLLNKIYVTSQNHGYAVKNSGFRENVMVTHTNLNDNTVAGISCPEKRCFSVQFHPENCPGPRDSLELFDYFIGQI